MSQQIKYDALDQYLRISRQWHGHTNDKSLTVAEGNKVLGAIIHNVQLPQMLRLRASQLQYEIIMFNQTTLTPAQESIIYVQH